MKRRHIVNTFILICSALFSVLTFSAALDLYASYGNSFFSNAINASEYKTKVIYLDSTDGSKLTVDYLEQYVSLLKKYDYQGCRVEGVKGEYAFCYITDIDFLKGLWLNNQSDLRPIVDDSVNYSTQGTDQYRIYIPKANDEIFFRYMVTDDPRMTSSPVWMFVATKEINQFNAFMQEVSAINPKIEAKVALELGGLDWNVVPFITYQMIALSGLIALIIVYIIIYDLGKSLKKTQLKLLEGHGYLNIVLKHVLNKLILAVTCVALSYLLFIKLFVHTDIVNQFFLYKVLGVTLVAFALFGLVLSVIPFLNTKIITVNTIIKGSQPQKKALSFIQTINLIVMIVLVVISMSSIYKVSPYMDALIHQNDISEENRNYYRVDPTYSSMSNGVDEGKQFSAMLNEKYDVLYRQQGNAIDQYHCFIYEVSAINKRYGLTLEDGNYHNQDAAKYMSKEYPNHNFSSQKEVYIPTRTVLIEEGQRWVYTYLYQADKCIFGIPEEISRGNTEIIIYDESLDEQALKDKILKEVNALGLDITIEVESIESQFNQMLANSFYHYINDLTFIVAVMVTFILQSVILSNMLFDMNKKKYRIYSYEGYHWQQKYLFDLLQIESLTLIVFGILIYRFGLFNSIIMTMILLWVISKIVILLKKKGR